MDQATLTEFYSTKKRPIEGFQPSKRRKVVQAEPVEVTRQKIRRADVTISSRRMKTRANAKTTESSTRKTRKNAAENTHSTALDAFLSAETKEISTKPEKVGIVVTSVNDNHDSVAVSFKETTTRRRKPAHKQQDDERLIEKNKEELVKDKEKNVQKARSTRRTKRGVTCTKETKVNTKTNAEDTIESNANSNEKNNDKIDKTDAKQSIMVKDKSPVRTNSSPGLKINPWIADQANRVLLSRGQTALLLSQQKSAKSKDVNSSKAKSQKPKETTKSLSKTKAQEGLEKARELIKKMRSLESDASKPKAVTTSDKTERLHKLAKRQSSEGASAESSVSTPKKAPAYERFHSLAQPSETTVTLPLPYKYKLLGEVFNSCDTILNLLGQRNETCIYDKLKESVQQMSRKRFERKHLAQMIFLMPNSYDVQQVRKNPKSASFQLTIQFGPGQNSKDCRLTIPTNELLSRRKVFFEKLLTVTKKHHQVFLKSLEVPLTIDDDKIIRWHPQFKLDDVPDIELSALPEAPVIKTFTSAQDVLERGRGLMTPRVEKALKNAALKSKEKPKLDITYDSQPKGEDNKKKETKQNSALKGISQDLLNKIRQKEAKKLEEKMMRDPVVDRKMIMQERLPELCRILKTYFTAEKKAAIPLDDATIKLSESYKSSLTPVQVEEHLRLLSELAPEWISVLLVRKCPYIKINKKADINNVISKMLQKQIK